MTETQQTLAQLSPILDRVTALQKELSDLRAGLKGPFVRDVQALMKGVPGLTKVSWTAYTPYFNDGDSCTFSSNHDDANYYFEGEDDPRFQYGVRLQYASAEDKKDPAFLGCVQIQTLLTALSDDDYHAMFGDHVEVEVYADKLETSSYDHD